MKSLIKMLRPNSLFGQLLLVTLLGAGLLQCVNFSAVYSIQQSYAREFLNTGHDYVVSLYLAIHPMSGEQRSKAMENIARSRIVNDKLFRARILNEEPDWETENYYKSLEMRDAVAAGIAAAGTPAPDIRARVLYSASLEASEPKYGEYLFPLLQVLIQIDDDNWLELAQPMVLTDFSLLRRQRALILTGSLAISFATVLLIRRATKPLHKLVQAAETFGRNPETAHPLKEEGSVEIREAAQSFNRMRKRICNNLNERNNMLEAMGHDLRTPLARIQLRLDKIDPESLREKFAANIDEIQSIVEQGLELARSLHTSEKECPLDIVAFIESIVDDIKAQGENVTLADTPGENDSSLLVMARPTCLKRSVENLLSNAILYAGAARISLAKNNGDIVIDIEDDGPGIPADMLEKVFEPYYRLEYSRNRESGGIGLGLAIARNMAALNNGSIRLINRREGGLLARISLPSLQEKTAVH